MYSPALPLYSPCRVGGGLACISSGGKVDHSALSALAPPPVFSLGARTLFHTQTTETRVCSLAQVRARCSDDPSSVGRAQLGMSALHPGRLIAACVLTCVIAGGIIARTRGAARPPDLRAVLTTCMDSDMDSVLVQPHSRASKQGAVTGNPRGSLARMLCCLAQQPNVNIVLDAFMGRGMTAATLGGCMERVGKQYWRISGFEMDPSTAMRARSILAHSGLAVKVLRCGSTLPEQPQHCNLQDIVRPRSATVIQGRLDAHNVQRLCARSAPDVVILDPISSVPNEIWAIHAECASPCISPCSRTAGHTWSDRRRAGLTPPPPLLSPHPHPPLRTEPSPRPPPRRCRPQFVILNNINLPDHCRLVQRAPAPGGLVAGGDQRLP